MTTQTHHPWKFSRSPNFAPSTNPCSRTWKLLNYGEFRSGSFHLSPCSFPPEPSPSFSNLNTSSPNHGHFNVQSLTGTASQLTSDRPLLPPRRFDDYRRRFRNASRHQLKHSNNSMWILRQQRRPVKSFANYPTCAAYRWLLTTRLRCPQRRFQIQSS